MSTLKTHNLQSPDAGSINIALAPNAGMVVSGLSTYSNQINVGSNIKLGNAGVITATSFTGSGANLTSLPAANLTGTLPTISGANLTNLPAQATIANNADNRVITGGSGVNLNGEAGLTYNGQAFQINSVTSENNAFRILNTSDNSVRYQINGEGNSFIGHTYPRADASIDLGYHTGYRWRDLVLSGGIRFGASGDNHYLDDYEEGTFTPQFDGLSNTPSYAARNGRYTKIGRYVHITGIIQTGGTNPTFSNTSAILTLTGLPFAGTGVIYYVSLGNVSHQHWDCYGSGNNEGNYSSGDTDFMNCQMVHNTSTMIFMMGKGSQTRARVRNNSMHNSGAIIIFELSYTV